MKIEKNSAYTFKFIVASGDDDYPFCSVNIAIFKWFIAFKIPNIIKPDIIKIRGKYNYDQYVPRRYGIYLFDNHFNICYGRGDGNFHREELGTEQRWSCFLPWNEWRFIRHSLYNDVGMMLWTGKHATDEYYSIKEKMIKKTFMVQDFDGEVILANCCIEEREWSKGEGWFKWLSFIVKNKVRKTIDIEFNKETGKRKGSWKGGTIGAGEDMNADDNIESALKRYCDRNVLVLL